jgi:hypothetical protein
MTLKFFDTWEEMNKVKENRFGDTLVSLELQLKTLFEGFGGEESVSLLSAIGQLPKAEQKHVIATFRHVCLRLTEHDVRLNDRSEHELKQFEERLYDDLVSSIDEEIKKRANDAEPDESKLIDLDEVRKQKKQTLQLV